MIEQKNISVVVVDDSAATRTVLRAILKGEGYQVIGEAADAESAIPLVRRLQPTVITLDMEMPGISGLEALPEIRQACPDSYVLVITSSQDQATLRRAFDLGAVGYASKPLTSAKVLQLFDQLVSVAAKPRRPAPVGATRGGGKSCVLVDDNRSVRNLLRAIVEQEGVRVVAEADNGFEGLTAIERELPDFACFDIDMPVLDGLNALMCLRAVHPTLPIVMVSSHTDRETIAATIAHGISGYLVKPFNAEKVVATLKKIGVIGPN